LKVEFDQNDWLSRGSLVAMRHQQTLMIRKKRQDLVNGDAALWDDLTQNVQPSWWTETEEEDDNGQRLLEEEQEKPMPQPNSIKPVFQRRLEELQQTGSNSTVNGLKRIVDQCDLDLYSEYRQRRLWPKWKVTSSTASALDPDVLHDLCVSERHTQALLEDHGLCFGCNDGCLPPYSVVLYARLKVDGDGFNMDCRKLADAWAPLQSKYEKRWTKCIHDMTEAKTGVEGPMPKSCDPYFTVALVDESFPSTGRVEYTSSVFMTLHDKKQELYDLRSQYDRGSDKITGKFDTQYEDFVTFYANEVLPQDMILAVGSAIITAVAILIHTRSLFMTLVGLVQILISFPMAFCAYRFLGGLTYFPFLNFVGVFVVFALGADHIFVAVDKWKNAVLEFPDADTEEIAAKALPGAAQAMFLTTVTTAVAFFGSAICPVAPVKLFSIFCGLLISLDYIMDVLIFFPALCVMDAYRSKKNCFMSFDTCCFPATRSSNDRNLKSEDDEEKSASNEEALAVKVAQLSLIHRVLSGYYAALHTFRWLLLAAVIAAIVVCSIFATNLQQPISNNLRVLHSDIEYEVASTWNSRLLFDKIQKESGGTAYVVFGAIPGDTGDYTNPESWTTLQLDDSFDPANTDSQIFLRNYCGRFLAQDFAKLTDDDYICPINRFNNWLQSQAKEDAPHEIYEKHCAGATGMPLPEDAFHSCLSAYAQHYNELFIQSRDGVVKIVHFPFRSNVQYLSPNEQISSEWHSIESWMQKDNENAPVGIVPFFSSSTFWFWDTNYQMFATAVSSAGIALATAAIAIFLSSRSFSMTIFSVMSVGYVLVSVTAMLVAADWEFGLLESICFTILIGVSVDFVVHFSHAYAESPGAVKKYERTKYALIHLGPSILAAAFTTAASATIMLFTTILFFRLFATIMLFTIIQSTVGSFVVFLSLTETMGPSNPTFVFDWISSKCQRVDAPFNSDTSLEMVETDCESLPSINESSIDANEERESLWEIDISV